MEEGGVGVVEVVVDVDASLCPDVESDPLGADVVEVVVVVVVVVEVGGLGVVGTDGSRWHHDAVDKT